MEHDLCQANRAPQHFYIITHPQELVNDFFELFIHSIR